MEKKKVAPKKAQKKVTQKKTQKKENNIEDIIDDIMKPITKKPVEKIKHEIRLDQEVLIPFKLIQKYGGEVLGKIQCNKKLESYFSIWFDKNNFVERNDKYYVKGIVERQVDDSNWEIRFSRKNSYFTINIHENMLEGIE